MKLKQTTKIFIVAALSALIMIHLFANEKVNLYGLEFFVNVKVSDKGITSINLPPLGVLKVRTHNSPMCINISLQHINLEFFKAFENSSGKAELIEIFKPAALKAIYRLVYKIFLLGALGGLIAALIMRLDKKHLVYSCLMGSLIAVLIISSIALTYNTNAFKNPEYSGTLKAAPWIIGLLDSGSSQINKLGEQFKNMSDNISMVFNRMEDIESIDGVEKTVKILHVSDIHNNPMAFDFMQQIVNNFNIDFIVDTGDITDYGPILEDMIKNNLSHLPVKYIFIPGNHDSYTTINMLKSIKNVFVLEDNMIEIEGIKILGFKDPVSQKSNILLPNRQEIAEMNLFVKEWFLANSDIPDILAVHNPKVTKNFTGIVPIILNGHTHKLEVKQEQDTIFINAGTTGAAGIRGFQSSNDVPYSAVVLYLMKSEQYTQKPKLIAADIIQISNIKAGFQVERIFFNKGETIDGEN